MFYIGASFPGVQYSNVNKSPLISPSKTMSVSESSDQRKETDMSVSSISSTGSGVGGNFSGFQMQRRQNWMSSLVSSLRSKKSQDRDDTAKS